MGLSGALNVTMENERSHEQRIYRRIQTHDDNGVTVVTLVDKKILDAVHIAELGDELVSLAEEQGRKSLVLDLSCDFLSSAAYNKLIILDKKLCAAGGRLVLCGLNTETADLFNYTHLDQLFTIRENRESALAMFQKQNQHA